MKPILISDIIATGKGAEYIESVMALGEVSGDFLYLSEADYAKLAADWPTPPLATQAKNLTADLSKWAQSGFKLVTPDELERRFKICEDCPFRKSSAFLALAKCKRCGCFGVKLHMGTTVCPAGKW